MSSSKSTFFMSSDKISPIVRLKKTPEIESLVSSKPSIKTLKLSTHLNCESEKQFVKPSNSNKITKQYCSLTTSLDPISTDSTDSSNYSKPSSPNSENEFFTSNLLSSSDEKLYDFGRIQNEQTVKFKNPSTEKNEDPSSISIQMSNEDSLSEFSNIASGLPCIKKFDKAARTSKYKAFPSPLTTNRKKLFKRKQRTSFTTVSTEINKKTQLRNVMNINSKPNQQNKTSSSFSNSYISESNHANDSSWENYTNETINSSEENITPKTTMTSTNSNTKQLDESKKSSNSKHIYGSNSNILNSTEKSIISNESVLFTNNSISEYLPDSTNDEIVNESLISNNSCSKNMEKSVNEILNPLNITNINIPYSNKSKKHFCVFCKTLQTKLARHLLTKHKSEDAIKAILHLPSKNKDRIKAISQLRKDGDFLHNTTDTFNTGVLIVSRQQQSKFNNKVADYVCCKNCKGFFSKKTLRIHLRKCGELKKNDRTNIISGRRLTQYIHEDANEMLKTKIFPILRNDKITSSIQYDELIIKFGNKLSEKYTLTHQDDMIRSHLRLLGRFKIAIKELCPNVEELKHIFKPHLFDSCVEALRKVANWDKNLMWFKTPAVAQQLTSLIKKCGYKQRTEYIKIQAADLKKDLEDFLLLWEEEVPILINKKACEDQANQKRDKKVILPSKEDIKKLYMFLKNKIIDDMKILERKFCYESWTSLTKATLIFIQIFNRRRAGEIERLKLSNYEIKEDITNNMEEEILKTISKESIAFAKQFVRITIRGKLGRTVSVLLSPLCVEAIDLIIKYREPAGITATNEYIFCKQVTSKLSKQYYRACPLLKQFSEECGALIPESLRGTTLRKHIATYTSLLNIEEASVDKLANFMGHHKDIHKNVYRMSVPVAEITCVSKLLLNAIIDENDEEDNEIISNTVNEEQTNNDINSNTDQNNISEEIPKKMKKRSTSPFGKTKRIPWTQDEKNAVVSMFGCLKDLDRLPSLSECIQAINMYPALKNRTPPQIKTWIDNQRRYK